jgi:hypothetical protein
MIYRKAAPNPPRLLLRIVASAGAGALLGVAACGPSDAPGSIVSVPHASDAATDAEVDGDQFAAGFCCGSVVGAPPGISPDGGILSYPADGGILSYPADAGDAGDSSDAPGDAESLGDTGAGSSDATDDVTHCGGFCGVVVHPDE